MIWNDDKISRLMSMGMMHGIEAGAGAAAGGGGFGGGGDVGGLGGGPDSGGIGSDTSAGGLGGAGVGGEGIGGDSSEFGEFLKKQVDKIPDIDKETIAKVGLGALGFLTAGLPGVGLGVKAGGALFGDENKGLIQGPPGGVAPTQATQTAPGQAPAQQLAGVPSAGGLAGPGVAQSQLGGDGAPQALQLAAAGRGSGIQPQVQPQVQAPQLGGRQILNRSGVLPTVDLQAFPGALGRIV